MQLGRNTLTTSTRRSLVLPRRYPTLLRTGILGSRYNSSASAGSSQSSKSSGSSAPLAFAVGSLLSGAIAYYAVSQANADASGRNRASAELNSQYGSPEDFKKAIAELRAAFPDEDAVTTDKEHLEEHGFSENDYHPGECHTSVHKIPRNERSAVRRTV